MQDINIDMVKENTELQIQVKQLKQEITALTELKKDTAIKYSKEEATLLYKIQQAKKDILCSNIKMTGKNSYQKYNYFELKDITPAIVDKLLSNGLASRFYVNNGVMYLVITDKDTGASFNWNCPLLSVETEVKTSKGDTGKLMKQEQALRTYARRTLWLEALDIVEPNIIEQETDKTQNKTKNESEYTIPENAPDSVKETLNNIKTTFDANNVPFNSTTINNKLKSLRKREEITFEALQEVKKYL